MVAERSRKVTYSFIDSYHSLCLDKKDIILAELDACRKLLRYAVDETEKTIERDIGITTGNRSNALILCSSLSLFFRYLSRL